MTDDDDNPFRNMPPVGPFIALRHIRMSSGPPTKRKRREKIAELCKVLALTIALYVAVAAALGVIFGGALLIAWLVTR